jgi:UDPglucose 6-dehydrogenase
MKTNPIGIIGYGIIGQTTHQVLFPDQPVKIFDIALESHVQDLYNCDLVFICTPTRNQQDLTAVRNYVSLLWSNNPATEVVIRSTVTPGFFNGAVGNLTYLPEFLRERMAVRDAESTNTMYYASTVDESRLEQCSNFNQKLKRLGFAELEILKLMSNNYRAMKVVFANHFYDLCQSHNADYDLLLENFNNIKNGQSYMEVRNDLRGYGGKCLPKDIDFAIEIFNNSSLFKSIKQDNAKWDSTVRKDQ